VTIVTARSDPYRDVALAWAAAVAFWRSPRWNSRRISIWR
jgi:hypothetical protein